MLLSLYPQYLEPCHIVDAQQIFSEVVNSFSLRISLHQVQLTSSGLVRFAQILEVSLWIDQLFLLVIETPGFNESVNFLFLSSTHPVILFFNMYWVSTDCQVLCYLLSPSQGPQPPSMTLKKFLKAQSLWIFPGRSPDKSLNKHQAVLLWALPACFLCFILCLLHTPVTREFYFAPLGGTVTS